MVDKTYERHSLAVTLQPYLVTKGWTGITTIYEGFAPQAQITPPFVSIYFLPGRGKELQMGRAITTQKSFTRNIQLDAYMETEARAMSITDDIADFLDETTITIVDPDSNSIGIMYVPNSELITTNTLPPIMTQPTVIRWRGITQSPLEVYYNLDS